MTMTDEEIDQAVERAVSGIERDGLERASSAEWPEVEADMALVERLGTFAKAAREIVQVVAEFDDKDVCPNCECTPQRAHDPECRVTKARAILSAQDHTAVC